MENEKRETEKRKQKKGKEKSKENNFNSPLQKTKLKAIIALKKQKVEKIRVKKR